MRQPNINSLLNSTQQGFLYGELPALLVVSHYLFFSPSLGESNSRPSLRTGCSGESPNGTTIACPLLSFLTSLQVRK